MTRFKFLGALGAACLSLTAGVLAVAAYAPFHYTWLGLPAFLLGFFLIKCRQKRNHLQRFSQSHIICQDPAEMIPRQRPHPRISDLLVFPQRLFQNRRNRIADTLRRF